jgi:SAM-dependent methyltransferase
MQEKSINSDVDGRGRALRERRSKRLRRRFRQGRKRFALLLVRLAFRVAKSGTKPYEPIEIGGRRYNNRRETDSRWQAIAAALKQCGARNVLDIGCAEGWFLRRAATDLNCFAIGIEPSDRVLVSEFARLYDGVERTAIVKAFLEPKDILALPSFDAVICTSVVHHVIRQRGLTTGEEFVRALATRANKLVLFEMGTSEEEDWSATLPEMREGQEAFVRDLLTRCGLSGIEVIARSEGFRRKDQRLLFSAKPLPG